MSIFLHLYIKLDRVEANYSEQKNRLCKVENIHWRQKYSFIVFSLDQTNQLRYTFIKNENSS